MTARSDGKRMPRESVPPLILLAFGSGCLTGAEVTKWIAAQTAGGYRPSVGSIYPRLGTMELRGLVTYKERPGKQGRAYKLTSKGRAALDAERGRAEQLLRSLKA